MKKNLIISIGLIGVAGYHFLSSCNQKSTSPEKTIAQILLLQIDVFDSSCATFLDMMENKNPGNEQLQSHFLEMRMDYKKIEWAAEYFDPAGSRLVNGPPVQEIEGDGQIFEPGGLQVVEPFLFPMYDSARKKDILKQLNMMHSICVRYRSRFMNIDILDWQLFDAIKLEVFRIMTLGITGFDNPLTLKSMQECSVSLVSLRKVIDQYGNENTKDLGYKIDRAVGYLNANPDFNSFNRMQFITVYCNPVTIAMSELENTLKIQVIKYNRLLNQNARTLFDTNAFNVNAYMPDYSSYITDQKIVLGKMLFSDKLLSGNGKRSCESCHNPANAFTDGLEKNTAIDSKELLPRNTPTLINASLQPALFYDLRAGSLEDQAATVVQSTKEMHGSMELSTKRLWQDSKYRKMFLSAFPGRDSTVVDTFEVMNAIGSYVRSLTFLNSRFDEYIRGNEKSMNANEINGFNAFMGKAKCATCHYMPLFNGTFPPRYIKMETEVIGVPSSVSGKTLDPDLGRFAIVHAESLKHAFKTPTVRNASVTAPYMHNGVFKTLEQVMEFYVKGGGVGLGIKIENQTLPFDSLSLSGKEQKDIIAFIKCLESKIPEKFN
jgi:cytochrome c peroxidase